MQSARAPTRRARRTAGGRRRASCTGRPTCSPVRAQRLARPLRATARSRTRTGARRPCACRRRARAPRRSRTHRSRAPRPPRTRRATSRAPCTCPRARWASGTASSVRALASSYVLVCNVFIFIQYISTRKRTIIHVHLFVRRYAEER